MSLSLWTNVFELDVQQYKQDLEEMYRDKVERYTVISYKVERFIG